MHMNYLDNGKIFNISLTQVSTKPRRFFSINFLKIFKIFRKFFETIFENFVGVSLHFTQNFLTFVCRVFQNFLKISWNCFFKFSWNFLSVFPQIFFGTFLNTFIFYENFSWIFKKILLRFSFLQNLNKILYKLKKKFFKLFQIFQVF